MLCNINIVGGWGGKKERKKETKESRKKNKEKGTVLDSYMYT